MQLPLELGVQGEKKTSENGDYCSYKNAAKEETYTITYM